jgi:hypothetical protein
MSKDNNRIGLRISDELKEALTKAAADNDRSYASYIKHLLTVTLRKAGYIKR